MSEHDARAGLVSITAKLSMPSPPRGWERLALWAFVFACTGYDLATGDGPVAALVSFIGGG